MARFVTRKYAFETGNINGILGISNWKRIKILILLYKGVKGKARIATDDFNNPKITRCTNQDSIAFRISSVNINAYK